MSMKIKSLADLRKIKSDVQEKIKLREQSQNAEHIVQIKVAMATCGIASGAKDIMNYMIVTLLLETWFFNSLLEQKS